MKKLAILPIVAILIFSGCTEEIRSDRVESPANIQDNINAIGNVETDIVDIEPEGNEITSNEIENKNWCTPGDKMMVNMMIGSEEYTVVGITDYNKNGKVHNGVCKAERPVEGGNSIIYFNEGYIKEGSKDKFFVMEFSTKGRNANAYSEAIVRS